MALTLAARLDAVETAITGILTNGQSIGHDGKNYTRADLGVLYQEQRYLEQRIAVASAGGYTVAEF